MKKTGCVNVAHMRIVPQGINSTENSNSKFAKNKVKTHCPRGHPYAGENLAIRHEVGPSGGARQMRICLTCYPAHWRNALIPRSKPPKGYTLKGKS